MGSLSYSGCACFSAQTIKDKTATKGDSFSIRHEYTKQPRHLGSDTKTGQYMMDIRKQLLSPITPLITHYTFIKENRNSFSMICKVNKKVDLKTGNIKADGLSSWKYEVLVLLHLVKVRSPCCSRHVLFTLANMQQGKFAVYVPPPLHYSS